MTNLEFLIKKLDEINEKHKALLEIKDLIYKTFDIFEGSIANYANESDDNKMLEIFNIKTNRFDISNRIEELVAIFIYLKAPTEHKDKLYSEISKEITKLKNENIGDKTDE